MQTDEAILPACGRRSRRRKTPWASMDMLRDLQVTDAQELRHDARDWAGTSEVDIFRCEVDRDGVATFFTLDERHSDQRKQFR